VINPHVFAHKVAVPDPLLTHARLQYARIVKKLNPGVARQLHLLAQQLILQEQRKPSVSSLQLQTRATTAVSSAQSGVLKGLSGSPSGVDIEELAFIVLMNATNDQDDDLRGIMNEVQAQTAAKQFLRQQMQIVNADVANNAASQGQRSAFRFALAGLAAKIIKH
jgi:hypothetical protein